MSVITNLQTQTGGISNRSIGHIVTDAGAAAAYTVQLGYAPRHIRLLNFTDSITDEWFEDMPADALQASIYGMCLKLDADAGVVDTDYTALWGRALPVAVNVSVSTDLTLIDSTYIGQQAAIKGICAKLDLDTGVTDTNYGALWGSPAATAVSIKAAIAGINAKLDLDAGVTDTNFAALWNASIVLSYHTVLNGTSSREAVNGFAIDDVNNTFTLTAATMVAGKTFYWVAEG